MSTGIRKWKRDVAIIGTAYTPFGDVLKTPAIKGMTYRELLSWAALEALENAGITSKEVDSLLVANYQTEPIKTQSIHAVAAEWLGLTTKPSIKYETACASGASGARLACSLIASGIDDVVLLVGGDVLNSVINDDLNEYRKNPADRLPIDPNLQYDFVGNGWDQAYFQPIAFDRVSGLSAFPILAYAQKFGLTVEQLDDAQNAAAISLRRNAARNPRAYHRKEYKDVAKEAGFNDVMDYMRSTRYNPWVSWLVRVSHLYSVADGGAALVFCSAEAAKEYADKPVYVEGVGLAAGFPFTKTPLNIPSEQSAFKQAYAMASLNPKEIDYLSLHDCFVHQHITVSEMAGYLAPGEGWKAIIEGRTAYDGDKPINTHGGCPSMGNAYDVSGIAEIAEAVQQMRGECGDRQIDPEPKVSVTHALGAGPTYGVTVLRRRE